MKSVLSYLRLACNYLQFNFKAHLEYRGAFLTQALAMFINNSFWLAFWTLFFTRFPALRGWTVNDVITLWALAASGFGIAHTLCWNALLLPQIIARGQLDVWMLYPRRLLPHLLLGKMSATAVGDALFGYVVYIGFVRPDLEHLLLFVFLTFAVGLVYMGFNVIAGSMGFFVGNAESLAEQWFFSMITFSTYPSSLFDGWVRVLLYTAIPAFFVSELPIQALRDMSLWHAALTLAGALAILGVSVLVFYIGLRRYESGNLTEMRS